MSLRTEVNGFLAGMAAGERNRLASGFDSAYGFTKDDGSGNQIPLTTNAERLVATRDKLVDYIREVVLGGEQKVLNAAVTLATPVDPDI